MSAASFFNSGTDRDRTLIRDEPRAGVEPLQTVPDGENVAFFIIVEEDEASDLWIQASKDDVVDLLEVQ